MEKNTKNLLSCELYGSSSYLERIFHGLINVVKLHETDEAVNLIKEFHIDLIELLEKNFVRSRFVVQEVSDISAEDLLTKSKSATQMIKSFLELGMNQENVVELLTKYINLIYSHSHDFHKFINRNSTIDIVLPRVNFVEMSLIEGNTEDNPQEIPLFSIPIKAVNKFLNTSKDDSISSLEYRREKKVETFIQEGHEAVFEKNFPLALEKFNKANNLVETAESLTLIGWGHSFIKNFEKAKHYCLKAIQKDPDYGPPYNDLGSYLLTEGHIEESLKWFELAKNAINYQNREYPYINAGRAYMNKKDYKSALIEFNQALRLAPFHEELKETVERLKKSLKKSTTFNDPVEPILFE